MGTISFLLLFDKVRSLSGQKCASRVVYFYAGLHTEGKLMKIDYLTTQMSIFTPPTENAGVYSVQGDPSHKPLPDGRISDPATILS